jgi:hypothetical protein
MRSMPILTATAVLLLGSAGMAAEITGEYLEARTCDVYTGPCFANAEMDLAGKEAVMAWKVDKGGWQGVSLDGLGAALVVRSEQTLGDDGVFAMKPGKIDSVILVDERATAEQRTALVAFVKDSAKDYTAHVRKIQSVPFHLENDHLSGKGIFSAGDVASIETRQLRNGDCVCTNEIVYYLPLTKVENFSPAYSLKLGYQGEGLNSQWTSRNLRSSFLATFRR